jgi:pyruvate dehydrogenase (quinone)
VTRNAPPLPAKITKEYRNNTIKSLLKGDPHEKDTIVDSGIAMAHEGIDRVKGALHIGSGAGQRD